MTRLKNGRRSRTENSRCVYEIALRIDAKAKSTVIELDVRARLQGKAEIVPQVDGGGTQCPGRCTHTFTEDEEARRACTDIRLDRRTRDEVILHRDGRRKDDRIVDQLCTSKAARAPSRVVRNVCGATVSVGLKRTGPMS